MSGTWDPLLLGLWVDPAVLPPAALFVFFAVLEPRPPLSVCSLVVLVSLPLASLRICLTFLEV